MKSLELVIVTCVLILHILKPSDGLYETGKQLLNVASHLESLQKSDLPCGHPEVLIPILKGNDPVKASPLEMMMASMDKITDITDLPDLNSIFIQLKYLRNELLPSDKSDVYYGWEDRLKFYLSSIDAQYERFKTLREAKGPINVSDWMALATDIENTKRFNLSTVRRELLDRRYHSGCGSLLMDFIESSTRRTLEPCMDVFGVNGVVNQLLNLLFTAHLKATVPQIFVSILRNCSGTVRRDNLNRLAIQHKDGYLEMVRGLKNAIEFVDDDMVPCRSYRDLFLRGKTYHDLENPEHSSLLQFPDPQSHESCLAAPKEQTWRFMSERDVCNGRLYDCDNATVEEGLRLVNNSRWENCILASSENYGETFDDCRDGRLRDYVREKNSSVGYCLCKCEETTNHISVTPVMTNRSADMVVTGFRFVRENGVLYLQAKQGKLLPGERIDRASEEWIPLPENPELVPLTSQNGKFHIGKVMADMNEVPVGISFVQGNNSFYLQMYAVSYDYYHGLLPAQPHVVCPADLKYPHTYVKFHLSNRGNDRRGKVLPLITAKAAESDPPTLLRGLGIEYDRWGMFSPTIEGFNLKAILQKIVNETL
ncbi:uncharacterized protein LOC135171447 [Diachasmimorpha longicaudata]|uniref:uncharacterized protein LOC135171447 n=1 Tax=Diachasmimorpha longicaudata TaxID=58733 RepID=UPI0030B8CA4D